MQRFGLESVPVKMYELPRVRVLKSRIGHALLDVSRDRWRVWWLMVMVCGLNGLSCIPRLYVPWYIYISAFFLFFHVSHPPFCCAADMNNELILKNKVLWFCIDTEEIGKPFFFPSFLFLKICNRKLMLFIVCGTWWCLGGLSLGLLHEKNISSTINSKLFPQSNKCKKKKTFTFKFSFFISVEITGL